MPGFRKGKAPQALLQQHVNMDVIREMMLKRYVDKASKDIVNTEKLRLVSHTPVMVNGVESTTFPLPITLTFTLYPDIKLPKPLTDYTQKLTIEPVDDKEIAHQMGHMFYKNGLYTVKDGIAEYGDVVLIRFLKVSDEKLSSVFILPEPLPFHLEEHSMDNNMRQKLIASKAGDIVHNYEMSVPERLKRLTDKDTIVVDYEVVSVCTMDLDALIKDKSDALRDVLGLSGDVNKKQIEDKVRIDSDTNARRHAEMEGVKTLRNTLSKAFVGDIAEGIYHKALSETLDPIVRNKDFQADPDAYFKALNTTQEQFVEDKKKMLEDEFRAFYGFENLINTHPQELSDEEKAMLQFQIQYQTMLQKQSKQASNKDHMEWYLTREMKIDKLLKTLLKE